MSYIHYIRADTIYNEDGKPLIVYGIAAITPEEDIFYSFPDLFFNIHNAEISVMLCNDSSLDITHLSDAVAEQYAAC